MKVAARKRTASSPIRALEPAPCVRLAVEGLEVLVAPGDRVEAGRCVAASPPGAPHERRVHSPYSGRIAAAGGDGEVAIEGLPAPAGAATHRGPCAVTPEDVVGAARQAGLVGLGGGSFPTHVKLSPGKPVELVIANGCESEPYLACDARVLAEHRDEVECGLRLAMRAAGAPRGEIVTGGDYPAGHERALVRDLLGREVPEGGLPRDAGAIVINVQTARALHQAVCLGRPLVDRVVTVDGGAVARPGNYVVPLGTELGHVLRACGTDLSRTAALVAGGPMMGVEATAETPLAAGMGGVLALEAREVHRPADAPCIRCGDCLEACPVGLSAQHLVLRPAPDLRRCILCGMCQYVCPAQRPLAALLRRAKELFP